MAAHQINDIMTRDFILVERSTPAVAVAARMCKCGADAIVVTDWGNVYGIITERDLVTRAVGGSLCRCRESAEDVCTRPAARLSPADAVDDAFAVMRRLESRRLPVVDGGRVVGIVSVSELPVERHKRSIRAT